MTRPRANKWILLGALLVLLAQQVNAQRSAPVKLSVCYENEAVWPFISKSGSHVPSLNPGIIIELVAALDAMEERIQVDFFREPWARCQNHLRGGKADALVASYAPERKQLGIYPTMAGSLDSRAAIIVSDLCLYTQNTRPLTWRNKGFSRVPTLPLSIPANYSGMTLLKHHGMPFVQARSSYQAMKRVATGKASGTILFCPTGDRFLAKYPSLAANITRNAEVLEQRHGYLIFSALFYRRHKRLAHAIWKQMASIREDHAEALWEKYNKLE